MTVVDKVLTHHSYSTLVLLATILAIATIYEALLGYARRLIVMVVGTRLDAKLNLHVFNRLLRLPLDYFERHPAGETMHKIAQVYKVREFLTGKLLATFLDMMTLAVLLPFLFYLNAFLAWMVLACSGLIMLVMLAYLQPLQRVFAKVVAAEAEKAAALGETIFGIKTVKSLALEPQRRMLWDARVAEAGKSRLAFGKLANWPQTIVTPIERFMSIGIVLVGAYIALTDSSGYAVGALFAFMMLSMRVAQPLVGLARLIEDYEEVGAAISEAASVLNRPLESMPLPADCVRNSPARSAFEDVSFTYGGTKIPALDRVTFAVPAGTMLGIVGRSGSGKSTLTRLLQGINRDYSGFLKIDGNDVREINLRHLRQSFGVVLQENFLFRGSIRDNIIAGRPGLTLDDAVRAARLAGAEEFIERMPNGYETLHRGRLAEPLGRTAAAAGDRARPDHRSAHPDPRRGDERARSGERGGVERQSASHRAWPDDGDRFAPPVVLGRLRPDPRPGKRQGWSTSRRTACFSNAARIYRQLWTQQNRHLENQGLTSCSSGSLSPAQ